MERDKELSLPEEKLHDNLAHRFIAGEYDFHSKVLAKQVQLSISDVNPAEQFISIKFNDDSGTNSATISITKDQHQDRPTIVASYYRLAKDENFSSDNSKIYRYYSGKSLETINDLPVALLNQFADVIIESQQKKPSDYDENHGIAC